jgi:hypothetical protein
MLKSYTAIYKQGYLQRLDQEPKQENSHVIVTFVENLQKIPETSAMTILRQAWGAVENPQTLAQIDDDIAQMRIEWE